MFLSYCEWWLQPILMHEYLCDQKLELEQKQENILCIRKYFVTQESTVSGLSVRKLIFFSDQNVFATWNLLHDKPVSISKIDEAQFLKLPSMCPIFQGPRGKNVSPITRIPQPKPALNIWGTWIRKTNEGSHSICLNNSKLQIKMTNFKIKYVLSPYRNKVLSIRVRA